MRWTCTAQGLGLIVFLSLFKYEPSFVCVFFFYFHKLLLFDAFL